MAMKMTWTDAGYAALLNAQHTGTLPVLCAQIAIGTGATPAAKTDTALQAEIKRVATISGSVVDANVLHVVLRDETADAYEVHEVGLISDAGVLLARYAQAAVITTKSPNATALIAIDAALDDIDTTQITFPSLEFVNPPWGENTQGVVQKATRAIAEAMTDNVRGMTAKLVKFLVDKWAELTLKGGAYLDVQASTVDDTPGKLLRTGGGGLLGFNQELMQGADADGLAKTQFFATANLPARWGQTEHSAGWIVQRDNRPNAFFFGNELELKAAHYVSETDGWSAPVKFWHSGNLQFATAAEAQARTDVEKVMSPATLGFAEQPTMTGSVTFTKATNNINVGQMVPTLLLEVGDVIQISNSQFNDKLYTIEAITDSNNVIVNYAHRNGAGTLSLTDEIKSVTIKRIAKWYQAPLTLGRAWVDVLPDRLVNVIYQGLMNRAMIVSVVGKYDNADNKQLTNKSIINVNGTVMNGWDMETGVNNLKQSGSALALICSGDTYMYSLSWPVAAWRELR